MQIGDWVEFDQVVVKQRHASGSTPATRALGRKRRGMVIGQRQVYDVTAGSPPALSNRRTVLLVAVTLRRCYRVFPTDVRPAGPARSRRKAAVSAVAAALAPAASAVGMPALGPAGSSVVALLVADLIKGRVAQRVPLLSCVITRQLRDSNPGATIVHEEVLRSLDAQMAPLIISGHYGRSVSTNGNCTHVWYIPA